MAARLEKDAWRRRDPVERLRYLRAASREPGARAARTRFRPRAFIAAVAAVLAASAPTGWSSRSPAPASAGEQPARAPAAVPQRVWLVEKTPEFELYSNGLRIERSLATAGANRRPRWLALTVAAAPPPDPAGIVFHASENDPAPFEPEWSPVLKRQGAALLEWVRRHALYHYLVDRFGRVHRVLEDTQRAAHAGHSVWADSQWIYLDLNESFLGVCFEASTTDPERTGLSAAQIHSGRLLVEMLRAVHGVPPGNFVTHAQVSVNPRNGRIGYHTDWADGFPFAELGLPDNYGQALAALRFFGFQADSGFLARAGDRLRAAVEATRQELAERARE
ncbi:MAG: peptidoglycan recognition protein family protein, partial [Bryobacteraceae bacterium]|nr:peptidoglycan recognition protein family protein [Bryobacteraceae bacterium]